MLVHQVALVSQTSKISASELSLVSAALQKQATRDFGPIWGVQASVDSFVKLEDVPLGYWPVIVKDNINQTGAAGVHEDKDGQPFALVQYDSQWSLTASHETLEMLGDPFGNRLVAGNSPKAGQGRVEFLVEVCDPSEGAHYAYTVNGIVVSDFYTPRFFDPVASSGVRYSFTGAIKKPRTILKGGYLSWHDPKTDHWWQQAWFGASKTYRDLGVFGKLTSSIRSHVDQITEAERQKVLKGQASTEVELTGAPVTMGEVQESTGCKAASWIEQIEGLMRSSG